MKILSKIKKWENSQKTFFFFLLIFTMKKSSLNMQYLDLVPWLSAESPPQWLRDPFQNGCCNRSVQFSLLKSNKQTEKAVAKYSSTERYQTRFWTQWTTEQLILLFTLIWSTNKFSYRTNFLPQIRMDKSHNTEVWD